MRKLLQSLKTGEIELVKAPIPSAGYRQIAIQTQYSLISAGTERMLLEFGKGNLVQKAMQQPDKVKQTLEKVRTDGLNATVEAVTSKLDQPIPLGYCNAGIVREVGKEVDHVKVGDRVVSNGHHSELVIISRNLIAKIPENVTSEAAAFTPLAAIALQGLRLAKPELGETFCIFGLGLVGLMTLQLLRANGCRVIGVDFSADRLSLAQKWGAETVNLSAGQDPVRAALAFTEGKGVDGVIIAAATDSQDPISQSPKMCRKRGRIILVGVTGLNLSRADFFEKEITFQVSCSYGPGRYDPNYEIRGEDYPEGYVRWTEQRNFDAVLNAMSSGQLDVSELISREIDFSDAATAYAALGEKKDLGILLKYPAAMLDMNEKSVSLLTPTATPKKQSGSVALIGAGGFGGRITAPALKSAGARLKTIVSRGGISSVIEGRKAGFETASTDFDAVLADPEVDTVVITTRHDTHAPMTLAAIKAGKHVFVEKPLALTHEDINAIETEISSQAKAGNPLHVMVGFNRRFSPYAMKMRSLLSTISEPKCLIATINAGSIPKDHWVHDPEQGGGRIIGEACHMIDLLRYFIGAPITNCTETAITKETSDGLVYDKVSVSLSFEDGSIGTVHYFANGPKALPKERYEAFAGGRYIKLDNFKALQTVGWPKSPKLRGKQDKGHKAAMAAFIDAVQNGNPTPIALDEILEVSRISIDLHKNS